jgi:hypothetical protein
MGPQFVNWESAQVWYDSASGHDAGHFIVHVDGVQTVWAMPHLAQHEPWVGGLRIDVLAWPYELSESQDAPGRTLTGIFEGGYLPSIVIWGANKHEAVPVNEWAAGEATDFLRSVAV